MARLKNNGVKVFETPKGLIFMSNGVVLVLRPNGGFRKVDKAKAGLTFEQLAAIFEKAGKVVIWHAPEWRDLRPAPATRTMRPAPASAVQSNWVDRRGPGLLRARKAQGLD